MGEKLISFYSFNSSYCNFIYSFALAMGIGTFIETYYSTDTAKILIYNAKWFELLC